MGKRLTERHGNSQPGPVDELPDTDAPTPPTITPRQERALQALLAGSTDAEAAAAAEVARETVNRWRHRDADFIAALNEARRSLAEDFHDGLRALLPDALAALRDGLAADDLNTRVRVAATLFRAMRETSEPTGSTDPDQIRLAWQTQRSELELTRRFSIL